MKEVKHLLIKKFGIDLAIFYSIVARLIQAGGALATISLISLFLSKEEQGYYYTFGSMMAVQVFFELGLTSIIIQYVAHEAVSIQWISPTMLTGSPEALSRLASILSFVFRVFILAGTLLFVVLIIAGFSFFLHFNGGTSNVNWQLPWIIVSLSTAIALVVNPVLAYFEGLGKVKEVALIRLQQQAVALLLSSLLLGSKLGLFALGGSALIANGLIITIFIFSYRRQLLLDIIKKASIWKISYRKDVFPYHYKIALSWIGGYLIFQLFNPILFATEGAVVAGQMGITLAALNGISSISMSWINTKVSVFSSYIAKGDFYNLDLVFNKAINQSVIVNFVLLLLFIIGIELLEIVYIPLRTRFLPDSSVLLLCVSVFVNQFVFSWATYLRCHKKEPFLVISVLNGILCAISSLTLSRYFGVLGMVSGYTALTVLISGIGGYYVFTVKRREWHDV